MSKIEQTLSAVDESFVYIAARGSIRRGCALLRFGVPVKNHKVIRRFTGTPVTPDRRSASPP